MTIERGSRINSIRTFAIRCLVAIGILHLPSVASLGQNAEASTSSEPKAAALFGARPTPSHGDPRAVGSYAKGCLAGGVELPESGSTWQAMRLSRNRNWGHPIAIDYVTELSSKVAEIEGWSGLYVGDIGQPRGGPMSSDHRSHQTGLDIDI